MLSKGKMFSAADDEMIQYAYIHQAQGVDQAASNRSIRLARLSQTRRMVMGQDQGAGVNL